MSRNLCPHEICELLCCEVGALHPLTASEGRDWMKKWSSAVLFRARWPILEARQQYWDTPPREQNKLFLIFCMDWVQWRWKCLIKFSVKSTQLSIGPVLEVWSSKVWISFVLITKFLAFSLRSFSQVNYPTSITTLSSSLPDCVFTFCSIIKMTT